MTSKYSVKNLEGYADPTAYEALTNIELEREETENRRKLD
jgi:hypothetical protein